MVGLSGTKYGVLRTISCRATWMAACTRPRTTLFSKFGPDGMTWTGMPPGSDSGSARSDATGWSPVSSSQSSRKKTSRSRTTGPRMRIHEST
ncbi:MAG: hypothetical protein ACKOHI_07855 [Phycisphaerales bacterium]